MGGRPPGENGVMPLSRLERPAIEHDRPPAWVLAMDLFEADTDFSCVRRVGASDGETLYFLAPTAEPGVLDLIQANADGSGAVGVVELATLAERGAEWSAEIDDAGYTVVLVVADGFERVSFDTIEVPVVENLALGRLPPGQWARAATLSGPAGTTTVELDEGWPGMAALMRDALSHPGLLDRLQEPDPSEVRFLRRRDDETR